MLFLGGGLSTSYSHAGVVLLLGHNVVLDCFVHWLFLEEQPLFQTFVMPNLSRSSYETLSCNALSCNFGFDVCNSIASAAAYLQS